MVKLILSNSAPPGQESQKWLENSATDLVTSRLRGVTKSDREVMKSDREVTRALVCARWPSPWPNFWDIFGSPGQEEPSWAKWVSPSILSMKTTTFKPNLYFCHRIPLTSHQKREVKGKLLNLTVSSTTNAVVLASERCLLSKNFVILVDWILKNCLTLLLMNTYWSIKTRITNVINAKISFIVQGC